MFVFYFLVSSLVFMGQDMSVRKDEDGTWLIALAEHGTAGWSRIPGHSSSTSHSGSSCGHGDHGSEIHICIDHHKFTAPCKASGVPEQEGLKAFPAPFPEITVLSGPGRHPQKIIRQCHGPGIRPSGPDPFSILLL